MLRQYIMRKKNRTLFEHMVNYLIVSTSRVGTWDGLTWFTRAGSLVSRTFSLLIRLTILTSTAIDDSIEGRPPFKEIWFMFLNFS